MDKSGNSLGMRMMVAEIRPKLARNIIFNNIVVSLLIVKYWFL